MEHRHRRTAIFTTEIMPNVTFLRLGICVVGDVAYVVTKIRSVFNVRLCSRPGSNRFIFLPFQLCRTNKYNSLSYDRR